MNTSFVMRGEKSISLHFFKRLKILKAMGCKIERMLNSPDKQDWETANMVSPGPG